MITINSAFGWLLDSDYNSLLNLFVTLYMMYSRAPQGCGQVPVLVLVLKYNFIST